MKTFLKNKKETNKKGLFKFNKEVLKIIEIARIGALFG